MLGNTHAGSLNLAHSLALTHSPPHSDIELCLLTNLIFGLSTLAGCGHSLVSFPEQTWPTRLLSYTHKVCSLLIVHTNVGLCTRRAPPAHTYAATKPEQGALADCCCLTHFSQSRSDNNSHFLYANPRQWQMEAQCLSSANIWKITQRMKHSDGAVFIFPLEMM
jgi:hypothetical protein